MLYLLRLVLRQLSRVVCRCSRAGWLAGWLWADTCSSSPVDAWWHSAAMLGDWVQSRVSLAQTMPKACFRHGHSRYTHGISTPTACLPACLPALCLAHRYHCYASGMPCPATAGEPRSILRRTLHTPSSLCTCMLACQTAANDVAGNRPQRFIVRVFSLLVDYYSVLLLRTCVCLTLTALLRSTRRLSPFC